MRQPNAPSPRLPGPTVPEKPVADAPPAPATPAPLPTLAAFAIEERNLLVDDADKDVWTRFAQLVALAGRIKPLLDHWLATGERSTAVHSMTVLATDLAKPTDSPNMADSLWFMAVVTLETVSKPKPPPRSTFWKH